MRQIHSSLHENVEYVAICVDSTPQPMFLAADCDDDFVQVPFVVGQRSIPADAVCEMSPKAVDP